MQMEHYVVTRDKLCVKCSVFNLLHWLLGYQSASRHSG